MLLRFRDFEVPVQITNRASVTSKHSSASLERLIVQAVVIGEDENERLLSLIAEARTEGVASVDETGSIIMRWKVSSNSWHYSEGDPTRVHDLEIEEMENLQVQRLTLGDLAIEPYSYEERFVDDTLAISARALLSEAQHAEMKDLWQSTDVFPVIRYGIDDEPRQMRFGMCYWSRHDDGIKIDLQLAEKTAQDPPSRIASAFAWMKPLIGQVAENNGLIDALLEVLIEEGVLTGEQVSKTRGKALEGLWDRRYELFRIEDIDDLA